MEPSLQQERVLDAVSRVPVGRVTTYGGIAELIDVGGPRQVGAALSRFGGGVPWHRVVRADGSPPAFKADEALSRLRAEGVPLRSDGQRVDLSAPGVRWP